jgi:hypothetical protein
MTNKKTKTRRKEDTPDERLAVVLMRYAAGWWEKAKLAVMARFEPSQVSMWERGDRPVPRYALERTADVTDFPRYLLGAMLRSIRSFRLAAKGKSRPGRALAEVSLVELFPLAASVLDLILDPLAEAEHREEQAQPSAADREQAEALFERLKRRTMEQRWLLVNEVAEFRQWPLVERMVAESLRLAPNQPKESLDWAKLAVRLAELVPDVDEWRWRSTTESSRADHALVSLDLSVVLLKQGETAQVRAIAEPMFPIFKSQQVHREALAALTLFCEAARQEAATVELTQKVVRFLRRAQDDPQLRFDQG